MSNRILYVAQTKLGMDSFVDIINDEFGLDGDIVTDVKSAINSLSSNGYGGVYMHGLWIQTGGFKISDNGLKAGDYGGGLCIAEYAAKEKGLPVLVQRLSAPVEVTDAVRNFGTNIIKDLPNMDDFLNQFGDLFYNHSI